MNSRVSSVSWQPRETYCPSELPHAVKSRLANPIPSLRKYSGNRIPKFLYTYTRGDSR